eukprot:1193240-Prorocentrum_minimum.AAC.6
MVDSTVPALDPQVVLRRGEEQLIRSLVGGGEVLFGGLQEGRTQRSGVVGRSGARDDVSAALHDDEAALGADGGVGALGPNVAALRGEHHGVHLVVHGVVELEPPGGCPEGHVHAFLYDASVPALSVDRF